MLKLILPLLLAFPVTVVAETFTGTAPVSLDYLAYLPDGYADNDDTYPLILFLHGAGERGDDLEVVKKHGPPKEIENGRKIDAVVIAPQCPANDYWHATELHALVDHLIDRYRIDEKRLYLTGLSMGGYGTWDLAVRLGDRVAAAVPICGGGKSFLARELAGTPLWVFHGEKDPVVPLRESLEMVQAVRRRGGDAKLTVYPDVGHESWTPAYADDSLYEWLFRQSR